MRLILPSSSKAALRHPKADVNHWKTLASNSEEQVFLLLEGFSQDESLAPLARGYEHMTEEELWHLERAKLQLGAAGDSLEQGRCLVRGYLGRLM